MKDYAVNKVKRIMSNKSVFLCRVCHMSHETFGKADACCKKQKEPYSKNKATFQAVYDRLVGKK